VNIFQKAAANLPLTPGQRAFLKFLQGTFWTAMLSGAQVALPLVQSQPLAAINWGNVGHNALIAFLVTAGLAFQKYFRAQGDTALATAVGGVVADLQAGQPMTVSATATAPAQ